MKLQELFNNRVKYVTSSKADGNMRTFSEDANSSILKNQSKVASSLGLGAERLLLVRCTYDRSCFTDYVFNPDAKAYSVENKTDIPPCDGILTNRADIGLILPLADCLGLTLYDSENNLLMVAHCGRHNLEQGGAKKAVEFMARYGSEPKNIKAFFSPVAGKANYQIHALDHQGITESALKQLISAGLLEQNIMHADIDTTKHDDYFSHSQGDSTSRFAIAARLLADTRNLVDKYKGQTNEAIIEDLDKTRIPLEIAIENLSHDFNIGTIVRNANAFNVSKVHIIGKRKYNRRGAMVTDKYLHIAHWPTAKEFIENAKQRNQKLISIENNRPNSKPLQQADFQKDTILIFGSESDGVSSELLDASISIYFIEQLGSTRSINVGCASSIALYEFCRQLNLLS